MLQELFGDEIETKRFAIRSSAIGEDGEDLSSAGQNATVLGCKGFDAIIKGLQKCWSSLLSYQSVEYRRQHGEPLIPGEYSVHFLITIPFLEQLKSFPIITVTVHQAWGWSFKRWSRRR